MRIAVMGAGAVGCFYGARLARAGEDVTFIARGKRLAALQRHGLRVESPLLGSFTLPSVQAASDPAAVGPVHLVLMTVKAYDLERASESVRALIGPDTLVLPLLNGVDIADRMAGILGEGRVLVGTVHVSVSVEPPNVIRHHAMDALRFGERAGAISAGTEALQRTFENAGISPGRSADIQRDVWAKFFAVNAFAGVCCLTRLAMGPIREDADTRTLLADAIAETVALARRKGVPAGDEDVEAVLNLADSLPPDAKPSMLRDLEQRRRLEVEVLQGTVVRMGRELGVPTPVHDVIYPALKLHAAGQAEGG